LRSISVAPQKIFGFEADHATRCMPFWFIAPISWGALKMEDQLCAFTTNGYLGDGSPDRADALIWGLTEIFPRVVSRGDGDWKSTRPHRDRPAFAHVGYESAKMRHRRLGGRLDDDRR
jgi:hypothetical protein